MKRVKLIIATACLAVVPVVGSAQQSAAENFCSRAPAEKKAECMKFVETCRWDEGKSGYVNRKDGKACGTAPAYMPTRAQIRAEREKFLANNKWDEGKSMWVPLDKSRQVYADKASGKTRDDVKADAQAFAKTHKWDEGKGMYVPVAK